MNKKYIMLSVIIALLVALSVTTSIIKSISGTVVDAETGKPVEGAAVLVEWTRRQGIGDYRTVSVRAGESVTDDSGKFYILGPLHPFVDPPDVTIYKKGYAAWNNKRIFPGYKHRQLSEHVYQTIKLVHFKQSYSYNEHIGFIRTCTSDVLASYKKKEFAAAYAWEIDLARREVLREK